QAWIEPVQADNDQTLDLRLRLSSPHEEPYDRLEGPDQYDPEGHQEGSEQDQDTARGGEPRTGTDVCRSRDTEQRDDDRGEGDRPEYPLRRRHEEETLDWPTEGWTRPVYRPRKGSAGAPVVGGSRYARGGRGLGGASNPAHPRPPRVTPTVWRQRRAARHACADTPGSSRPTP